MYVRIIRDADLVMVINYEIASDLQMKPAKILRLQCPKTTVA